MSINHSAEYLVLWKSHKRAEWEAVRLKEEADTLRQQAAASDGRSAGSPRPSVAATVEVTGESAEDLEAMAQALEEEGRRKQEFCAEIAAELERVASALTPAQRNEAEKVLKQWETEQK